jgi:hypothetical protein
MLKSSNPSPENPPSHLSPPGSADGGVPPLSLNALTHPGSSPQHPNMLGDGTLDTPHSVSEILDAPNEFNDLMRFLDNEPDNDIDF